jgi:hypothetical protein
MNKDDKELLWASFIFKCKYCGDPLSTGEAGMKMLLLSKDSQDVLCPKIACRTLQSLERASQDER